MTKKTLEKLSPSVRSHIEKFKEDLKKHPEFRGEIRFQLLGYVDALEETGTVSEQERRVLLSYATL